MEQTWCFLSNLDFARIRLRYQIEPVPRLWPVLNIMAEKRTICKPKQRRNEMFYYNYKNYLSLLRPYKGQSHKPQTKYRSVQTTTNSCKDHVTGTNVVQNPFSTDTIVRHAEGLINPVYFATLCASKGLIFAGICGCGNHPSTPDVSSITASFFQLDWNSVSEGIPIWDRNS